MLVLPGEFQGNLCFSHSTVSVNDNNSVTAPGESLMDLLKAVSSTSEMLCCVPGQKDTSSALDWAMLYEDSDAVRYVSEYRVIGVVVFTNFMMIDGHSKGVFALDVEKR
jgi:hypothetical protein